MCIALDTILSDQQTHDARDKFANIFQQLMEAKVLTANVADSPCEQRKAIAAQLTELASSHEECLQTLPRHDTYSRHIIGTQDNWVGLICRWEQNITSTIHGHPAFAYYQVLGGRIAMELFKPVSASEATMVSTTEMCAGDNILSTQQEGQYDNLIHRIRTESPGVFTLHLYSDNPAKGQVFKAV